MVTMTTVAALPVAMVLQLSMPLPLPLLLLPHIIIINKLKCSSRVFTHQKPIYHQKYLLSFGNEFYPLFFCFVCVAVHTHIYNDYSYFMTRHFWLGYTYNDRFLFLFPLPCRCRCRCCCCCCNNIKLIVLTAR